MFHTIYYASRTLDDAQKNYTTTKTMILAIVFAFGMFRYYLVLSKIVVFIDHFTIKFLLSKQEAKPWLIRWTLLLQESNMEIKGKKGPKNLDPQSHSLQMMG